MPDIVILLRIPADKVAVAKEGFFAIHPIPETAEWIADPDAGATGTEQQAWVRECVRVWIRGEVRRGKQTITARDVVVDDGMVIIDP